MIDWGYKAQRLAQSRVASARASRRPRAAGHHRQAADQGAGHPLRQQAHARRTAEEDRARAARHRGPQLRAHHPRSAGPPRDSEAVFYFPGCGSERLFSQVGLATQAMLWHVGVQTVLPPGYLCCGYPQRGAGEFDKAEKIITDNRVLFHRVANTLNYLDIKTVVVSCGTCFDQLQGYEFEKIFPGCKIIDIHEYLHGEGRAAGECHRRALHVSRSLSFADEEARSARPS